MSEMTKMVGDDGERRAAEWYCARGFGVVARNFRTRFGEIDVVADNGETLVFCEVKTWPKGDGDTVSIALGEKKQRKIIKNSKIFVANNRKYSDRLVRFDVLLIDFPDFEPVHAIENAFSEI